MIVDDEAVGGGKMEEKTGSDGQMVVMACGRVSRGRER